MVRLEIQERCYVPPNAANATSPAPGTHVTIPTTFQDPDIPILKEAKAEYAKSQ